jgi:hypothetical protein
MMVLMVLLLAACGGPLSSTLPPVDTDTDDTGGPVETPPLEHCGPIEVNETWGPNRKHLVTCDVSVTYGTLTISPGASVEFAERTGLTVGTTDYETSLVVDGATAGVVFSPAGSGEWDGITIGETATGVRLTGLSVRGTTGGVTVAGAEVAIGSLAIDGASAGCGLTLSGGARLADGSAGVTIAGAGTYAACVEAQTADSLPAEASGYTGNGEDAVFVEGSSITASTTWKDLGVPYVVAETIDVGGTAGEPAVLTIGPGVNVQFERDRGLRFSRSGEASALVVAGTADAPVTLTAHGADNAGFWRGIDASRGTSVIQLDHVGIYAAGGAEAAVVADDVPVSVNHVIVGRSAEAGVGRAGGAAVICGGVGGVINDCEVPILLPAAAVPSIPTSGLSLTGNNMDVIKVAGVSAVSSSGTWLDAGIPYWLDDDIDIDGTAENPAIVTLQPGITLYFGNSKGIFVGKTGAAGLRVEGSEALPVTMEPWSADMPGAWAGVAVYGAALDEDVLFRHTVIGYAGGTALKGNLQFDDASPTLESVVLDGLEWGLYVTGTSEPVLTDVTYSNNGSGECSGCP